MRISDWSSDVCSSDLGAPVDTIGETADRPLQHETAEDRRAHEPGRSLGVQPDLLGVDRSEAVEGADRNAAGEGPEHAEGRNRIERAQAEGRRSEEHTSELQSLMRISYAVFCLQTTKIQQNRS